VPVRKPLPSGLNGTKPMPNSAHVGAAHAGNDLSRSAVTALERVLVDERLLQWMQPAVALQPFDRGDFGAVVHHR
jgi:hypothetical protein